MRTRKVLALMNAVIATQSAVLLAVSGFWGISGGKLVIVSVAVAACIWSALGDLEIDYLERGKAKDGKERERKNAEAVVRGIKGDTVQFRESGRGHRHSRVNAEKVRTRA
jgi:hypothetical protein